VVALVVAGRGAAVDADEGPDHDESAEQAQGGDGESSGREQLAHAMKDAKLLLERGMAASAGEGVPISAKYEVEDGNLQLSVYTINEGAFAEVIVDHATGSVARSTPITAGEDLAAASEQHQAMKAARRTLEAAAAAATRENRGWRTVSAVPRLEGGHPVAVVTLLRGERWKAVRVRLDDAR
jgi:hypothetical protein